MRHYDPPASNGAGSVMAQRENEDPESLGHKMARAYGHPLRARALIILGRKEASPKQIAEELGEPIGKVSYHIRELRDMGLIELIGTDASRGGVQHFYRATRLVVVDRDETEAMDAEERAAGSSVVINLMVSDVADAVEAGTFDSQPERVLSRYHAIVDKQGLDELSKLYTDAIYRSIEIHEESNERLERSGGPGMPFAVHALVFEMPGAEQIP